MPYTHMSEPPSDKFPNEPPGEPIASVSRERDRAKREVFPFGLSAEEFALVSRAMRAIARKVCRHSLASPDDAVQNAFITALSKPTAERPSIQDQKKLIAWMCELAKCAALTNRQSALRRGRRELNSTGEMPELGTVPSSLGAVEAHKMLGEHFMKLDPEEQALLFALYAQEKTTKEVACEQQRHPNTVNSRRQRLLKLLYAAIQATVAALILVPKKARAFVAHVGQQAPQMLAQATQFTGAMTITMVCGALLPTSSSAPTEPSALLGLTAYGRSQRTMAQTADLEPSFVPEVEPEEPKELDAETNQCSAADMKSTKFANILPKTLVPLALAAAPSLAQVACTGTEQQTPPARQPVDEPDDEEYGRERERRYEIFCDQERRWGNKCPTREEYEKLMGIR